MVTSPVDLMVEVESMEPEVLIVVLPVITEAPSSVPAVM